MADGQAILITCTAPIRLARKTGRALIDLAKRGFSGTETLYGNRVSLRIAAGVPADRPRVLCLVHNADEDAARILDHAERVLGQPFLPTLGSVPLSRR